MSIFSVRNGKKLLPRSIYLKILVLICLIGISAIALKPIQSALGTAISNIRTNFIEKLEDYLGLEINYASIRPAFFNSFDIRNLKLYKDDREILTISRARFYFSIRELLFNRNTSIYIIQIDRPVFKLNMDTDREIIEHFKYISGGSENNTELIEQITKFLPDNADYRIRNGSFSFYDGETEFQAENVNVNIRGEDSSFLLDLNFGAYIKYAGFLNRTLIVNTDIGINGIYLKNENEGKAEITFSSLACSEQNVRRRSTSFLRPAAGESTGTRRLFTLHPVTIGFSYKDRLVSIITPMDKTGVDYFFIYDTETGGIQARADFDDYIPLSIFNSFSDQLKTFEHFLDKAITGNLSFKYETDSSFDYYIDLQSSSVVRTWPGAANLTDAFLIRAYGNNKNITVNDFCVNTSLNPSGSFSFPVIVNYSGSIGFAPLRPSGTLSIEHHSSAGKEDIKGIFYISSTAAEINILGDRITIGDTAFNNLDIHLFSSSRDYALTLSAGLTDNSKIYLDAVINRNLNLLEASLRLDSFSLFSALEISRPFFGFLNTPLYDNIYTQKTYIDADIFVSSNFNNITYNAPGIIIRNDKNIGTFSLSGSDNHFTLSEGVFYLGDNDLFVSAYADFSNPMDLDFTVNANYQDMSWNINGQILDRTTFIVRDPNGLHAYGYKSSTGEISGFIEGIDFPIPTNLYPAYTNFYITTRYNSRDFWSVDVAHFRVRDLFSHNGTVNVSVSGIADQNGANFKDMLYSDNKGMLAGNADFFWNTDFSSLKFNINMADIEKDEEFYLIEGIFENKNFDLNANVSNVRIDRFIKGSGSILASAEANVSWASLESFNAHINLSSFRARTRTNEIDTSFDLLFSSEELLVQELKFSYSGINASFPDFFVKPKEGLIKIGADINGKAGIKDLEGKITLDANFNKINSWIDVLQAYNSFNGTLMFENIKYGELSQDNMVFHFLRDEENISVSGGINEMLKLEMDNEGNFYLGLSEPAPIRGSFAGIYKNMEFDAYCNDFYIDLAALYSLGNTNTDNFNISGGYITGKMNLSGPVWNPEFYGTGRGTSLSLQVPEYVSEDIRPVPFDVIAEGYEMTFGPVVAVSGSGSGIATGWFRFEYWVPRNVGLSILIPRETPIPYNTNIAGFHAKGNASGNLNLELNSNDKVLEILGDFFMNNTEMGINIDEITANRDEIVSESVYNTVVDISITTGSTVEFFWPNINNPILRVNPEMGTVFKVSYETESGQYSMVSDIRIRSGEMYYLDRYFYIRQGSLTFRENERQFDPQLSVRAEIRDRSDSGPVTIFMIIDNQPLLSFVPRFESSPGLTQLEIFSILGQNPSIQGNEGSDAAQRLLLSSSAELMTHLFAGSEVFSQMMFVRQFERRLRNFLHLDMLSIRTRFLQNAVVSGAAMVVDSPLDRDNRVGNYFDNTTVFIGKYIGQDMFIQSTLTLKYDENSLSFGGLRFEPDIGLELQSPFFNIRWEFSPYHPKKWWVNDHSITLLWSKSFR